MKLLTNLSFWIATVFILISCGGTPVNGKVKPAPVLPAPTDAEPQPNLAKSPAPNRIEALVGFCQWLGHQNQLDSSGNASWVVENIQKSSFGEVVKETRKAVVQATCSAPTPEFGVSFEDSYARRGNLVSNKNTRSIQLEFDLDSKKVSNLHKVVSSISTNGVESSVSTDSVFEISNLNLESSSPGQVELTYEMRGTELQKNNSNSPNNSALNIKGRLIIYLVGGIFQMTAHHESLNEGEASNSSAYDF